MNAWYRNDKLRIALMALVAGLVVGGVVTYAASLGSSKPKLGASDASVAAAIASDQAKQPAAPAKLTPKPTLNTRAKAKPKAKRVVKRSKGKTKRAAALPGSPEATATPDSDAKADEKSSDATPVAAAPRRQATQRVVAKRKTTVTPQKRTTTPKSTPAPTPSKPAPAPTSAPAPAPTSAPAPSSTSQPTTGHGNGTGGDDDPGNGG